MSGIDLNAPLCSLRSSVTSYNCHPSVHALIFAISARSSLPDRLPLSFGGDEREQQCVKVYQNTRSIEHQNARRTLSRIAARSQSRQALGVHGASVTDAPSAFFTNNLSPSRFVSFGGQEGERGGREREGASRGGEEQHRLEAARASDSISALVGHIGLRAFASRSTAGRTARRATSGETRTEESDRDKMKKGMRARGYFAELEATED